MAKTLALLGHKQTQTTARYAHLIGQPLIEASEKIGGKIMAGGAKSELFSA